MSEKHFSIDRLRDILDKMGYRHLKKDGAIYATFHNDEYPNPLTCLFTSGGSKIQAAAWMEGVCCDAASRVAGLEFCNDWNYGKVNPRAYLDADGDLRVDMTLFVDETLTDEYVEENFVRLFLGTTDEFYKEAAKKFF